MRSWRSSCGARIFPLPGSRALCALLSKLRRTLQGAGLSSEVLAHAFGCYQLRLPVDAWVDVDAAGDAVQFTALRQRTVTEDV